MSGLAVIIYGSKSVDTGEAQAGFDTFCPCDFICDYEEKVFSDISSEAHKHDMTEVLFRKVSSSDTVEIKLFRYGNEVAVLNDNTYGTFYNGFNAQPNYVGFLIDWTLVFAAFSGGQYQIKTDLNILGTPSTIESRLFRLNTWNEQSANNTVKIESFQQGNIIGSEFDYTDLLSSGWYQSLRMPGSFGKNTPSLESDIFVNTSYQRVQNRDKVTNEYTLELKDITEEILNRFTNDNVISNTILITDYNLRATNIYRQKSVYIDSISDVTHLDNGRVNATLLCRDRDQNIIKTNA